jgi:hypothetical protein
MSPTQAQHSFPFVDTYIYSHCTSPLVSLHIPLLHSTTTLLHFPQACLHCSSTQSYHIMSPIPSNDAQSNDAGSLANSVFDTSSTRPPATHLNPSVDLDQSQQQGLPSRSGASKVYYTNTKPPPGTIGARHFPNASICKLLCYILLYMAADSIRHHCGSPWTS